VRGARRGTPPPGVHDRPALRPGRPRPAWPAADRDHQGRAWRAPLAGRHGGQHHALRRVSCRRRGAHGGPGDHRDRRRAQRASSGRCSGAGLTAARTRQAGRHRRRGTGHCLGPPAVQREGVGLQGLVSAHRVVARLRRRGHRVRSRHGYLHRSPAGPRPDHRRPAVAGAHRQVRRTRRHRRDRGRARSGTLTVCGRRRRQVSAPRCTGRRPHRGATTGRHRAASR